MPGKLGGRRLRTDGQQTVLIHLPAGDLHPAQIDAHTRARLRLRLSVMWIEGTRKPICCARCLPQSLDAGQQLAALLGVHQRHQPVADFKPEFVELEHRSMDRARRAPRRWPPCRLPRSPVQRGGSGVAWIAASDQDQQPADQEERKLGQPGDQRQRQQSRRRRCTERAPLENSCLPTSAPRCLLRRRARHTMPPAIDTSSEGIMVTRPSPTVSTV